MTSPVTEQVEPPGCWLWRGSLSIRFTEDESKRKDEDLYANVVFDAQDPTAPIFETSCRRQGANDGGGAITGFCEVVYHGAAAIDQDFVCVGAVEINLCQLSLLQ